MQDVIFLSQSVSIQHTCFKDSLLCRFCSNCSLLKTEITPFCQTAPCSCRASSCEFCEFPDMTNPETMADTFRPPQPGLSCTAVQIWFPRYSSLKSAGTISRSGSERLAVTFCSLSNPSNASFSFCGGSCSYELLSAADVTVFPGLIVTRADRNATVLPSEWRLLNIGSTVTGG